MYCHSADPSEQRQYDANLSSLWWENDAETILLTSEDLDDLRLVCLFAPHQRQQFPDFCLSQRQNGAIGSSLTWSEGYNHLKEGDLSLNKAHPAPPITWDEDWLLPDTNLPFDACSIAERIDQKMCVEFCRIPFRDWVRAALRYTSDSVEHLLAGAVSLQARLKHRFANLQEPTEKYELVKYVTHFTVM